MLCKLDRNLSATSSICSRRQIRDSEVLESFPRHSKPSLTLARQQPTEKPSIPPASIYLFSQTTGKFILAVLMGGLTIELQVIFQIGDVRSYPT